jgi:hypothetical protein
MGACHVRTLEAMRTQACFADDTNRAENKHAGSRQNFIHRKASRRTLQIQAKAPYSRRSILTVQAVLAILTGFYLPIFNHHRKKETIEGNGNEKASSFQRNNNSLGDIDPGLRDKPDHERQRFDD